MPLYDFSLQDGRDGSFSVNQHNATADLDAAVRKAVEWAKDTRGIYGDPSDFSRWAVRIFEGQGVGQEAGTHMLFEMQDVRPDDWPGEPQGTD